MSARLTEAEVRAMLERATQGPPAWAFLPWERYRDEARRVYEDDVCLAREVLAFMGERDQWRRELDEAVAFSDVVVKERDEARAALRKGDMK